MVGRRQEHTNERDQKSSGCVRIPALSKRKKKKNTFSQTDREFREYKECSLEFHQHSWPSPLCEESRKASLLWRSSLSRSCSRGVPESRTRPSQPCQFPAGCGAQSVHSSRGQKHGMQRGKQNCAHTADGKPRKKETAPATGKQNAPAI